MVKETMQSVHLPIRELKVRMYKVVHREILTTSAVSMFHFSQTLHYTCIKMLTVCFEFHIIRKG